MVDINWVDTLWVMLSAFLVFLMIPANGFFYAGTVEFKNSISVLFMVILTLSIVGIQWMLFGYSLAFSPTSKAKFIGDTEFFGLRNVGIDPHPNAPTIPNSVFMFYQAMFAILTPSLAFGSIAERTRIIPYIVFLILWSTFVYDIVAFWCWAPNGWLSTWGLKDFAGGIVVHTVSGFGGLAAALILGKRNSPASLPHNLTLTSLGATLLWFGWFGFNGGSEGALDERAINACVVTFIATAFGGITWVLYDYRLHQKITSLGFASGLVSGLVCITPAAGFTTTYYAPLFGIVSALVGNQACFLKSYLDFDDTLDVFAVHGVVGFVGTLMTGIFSDSGIGNLAQDRGDKGGWVNGNWFAMAPQAVGVVVGAAYAFFMTALIVFLMSKIQFPWFGGKWISLNLRMNPDDELAGTDFSLMGEVAYDFTYTGKKANDGGYAI